MCGIAAYLGDSDAVKIIIESMKMICNRGYDSCGLFCYKNENRSDIIKSITTNNILSIKNIEEQSYQYQNNNYSLALGHTRWATHGPATLENAHPHTDNDNKIFLVHNGIINNYLELKKELLSHNYTFYSQTDTEVIVNWLSYEIKKQNNHSNPNIEEAMVNTMRKIDGTYGICFFIKDSPNKLYCFKNGSPLIVNISNNYAMISSELSGFNNLVDTYFVLENDDYCILEKNENNSISYITNKNYNFSILDKQQEITSKGNFDHWTLKEINEQTNSIKNAFNNGGRINKNKIKLGGIEEKREILQQKKEILIIGCGTSYHAAKIGELYFKCNTNFRVNAIDGCEFNSLDIPKNPENCAIILMSQSGETRDLVCALDIIKKYNIITIGCINVVNSLIAREVDCGVYLNAGREVGVASTKSFTSQLVVLNLLSLWFSNNNCNLIKCCNNISNTSIKVKQLLACNKQLSIIKNYASIIKDEHSMFILGKKELFHVAEEAALKIKEISYIHAESYSGSALKHGPFSLLKKNMPVVLIIHKDEHYHKMISAFEEIRSRYANILILTNDKTIDHDNKLIIDCENSIKEINYIIPLQLLAYFISIEKNINPDYPRNLAKVVTVE